MPLQNTNYGIPSLINHLENGPNMKFGFAYFDHASKIFAKYLLLRILLFFILTVIVWSIRFPFVFKKLYAEDGTVLLRDALLTNFPK